ncbi:MAG TPA: endolytic transglycosylase MltG [Fimbriimonadaceae bacterium]|nr:endolytic transglycosylase MltG [Fimbriimonadaceae bacterium]
MKRALKRLFGLLLVLGVLALAAWLWIQREIAPTAKTPEFYYRVEGSPNLPQVLNELRARGVVRNPDALRLYATIVRRQPRIREGTYRLAGGLEADEILKRLGEPIRQMVRIPETNLLVRTARLLEQKEVLKAEEYLTLARSPEGFRERFPEIPLPKESLDGYLFPDTYDLPPLLGAEKTIVKQLQAFRDKVMPVVKDPENLHRAIIVASMVELEAARDEERPVIAGVIENRLRLGMPLQIDATVLYALGEWKNLTRAELRSTQSPYNTYLNKGLPPGPICSPSLASIQGALQPAKHDYLFYVAIPGTGGRHAFAATYEEHLANIAKRRRLQSQGVQ